MPLTLRVVEMLAAFEECGRETEFFGFDTLKEALDTTCPLQFDVRGPSIPRQVPESCLDQQRLFLLPMVQQCELCVVATQQ